MAIVIYMHIIFMTNICNKGVLILYYGLLLICDAPVMKLYGFYVNTMIEPMIEPIKNKLYLIIYNYESKHSYIVVLIHLVKKWSL